MIGRDEFSTARRRLNPILVGIAVGAGAFCLVTGAMLLWNYHQVGGASALVDQEKLTPLKKIILDGAADEAVRDKFRVADQELRVEYFQRRALARRGAWLLACGLVVLVVALSVLAELNKRLPGRPRSRVINDELHRSALWGRWATMMFCVLAAGGALAWAATSGWSPDISALVRPVVVAEVETGPPTADEIARNWHRFRGVSGSGVSNHKDIPLKWDGPSGAGIVWKSPVALDGKNSPVVWGDMVFLTGATKDRREVYCFDASSGNLLWKKTPIVVGSRMGELTKPEFSGYAAPSVVTDGRVVCAIFFNGDLACFDMKGKQLWSKMHGYFINGYGYASSLAIWKDYLIVQLDQGEEDDALSELLAVEVKTGKIAWSAPRDMRQSWPSPIVITAAGRDQIITCGSPYVVSYAPDSGEELWRVKCLDGDDVGPSPIFAGGLVFVANEPPAVTAIRPDGSGDVTETHIAWQGYDGLPDTVSPVSDGKLLWLVSYSGITCYRASDGKLLYTQDMEDGFTASPSIVGDKLYMVSDIGVTHIVSAGEKFKLIGKNALGEKVAASPAFVDGRVFIRGAKNLYCIDGK